MQNYHKPFSTASQSFKRKPLRAISFLSILTVVMAPVSARAYDTFSCSTGNEQTGLEVTSQSGGWENAERLIDDDPNSGWAKNYPGTAVAKLSLSEPTNVSEIYFFVPNWHDSSGSVIVETREENGSTIQVKTVAVNGSGWHSTSFNSPNTRQLKIIRSEGENVFELKVCGGNNSSTSQITIDNVSVVEAEAPITLTILVDPVISQDIQIEVITGGGNAEPGSDYTSINETLTIPANEPSYTFDILMHEDPVIEPTETFNVNLSLISPTSGLTLVNDMAVVSISDNDGVTSQCDDGSAYNSMTVPQACSPEEMGIAKSMSFGDWRERINPLDTDVLTEDCRNLHDLFWVKGDDMKAYHTWHPPVADNCVFRHEHGQDPSTSDILEYAEGYPPFGYAMSQQMQNMQDMGEGHLMRHEPHYGHKVVVANNIRLAVGEPQQGKKVTKFGVTCDWLSKIHQGSYSSDAMTNHLHEYFLNVQCDDEYREARTPEKDSVKSSSKTNERLNDKLTTNGETSNKLEFAIKALAQWGRPNEVHIKSGDFTEDALTEIKSELTKPWNDNPDLLDPNYLGAPTGAGGQREFDDFGAFIYKEWASPSKIRQPELWSGNTTYFLRIPGGGTVKFAPYYTVKNPARLMLPVDNYPEDDIKFVLKPTIEWCYKDEDSRPKISGAFCDILPDSYPGPDYWKSVESPFNGTVRAVNFKRLRLENIGGPTEFCTDAFGFNPTEMVDNTCDGKVRQRASNSSTSHWDDINGDEDLRVSGSIEKWTFGYDVETGQWESNQIEPIPNSNDEYEGAGIGFEWIINNGNAEGVRVPN